MEKDITYISSGIFLLYFITFLLIGNSLLKVDTFDWSDKQFEFPWFISEQVLGLGLLGTVIGFMYMLSNDFMSTKLENTESVIRLMSNMSLSMGTALLTTATGLIASILLKTQIVILDRFIQNEL